MKKTGLKDLFFSIFTKKLAATARFKREDS